MSNEEYKQLEILLGKLTEELGSKYCIIPNYIHDGYCISIYSSNCGLPLKTETSYSIESTVNKLKS